MNYYRFFVSLLTLLICLLQYRLWFGEGNVGQVQAYQQQLTELELKVRSHRERNDALYAEVLDLRKGSDAIEERARYQLGMIKPGETFFQIIN